jgi:hypothetical protein
MNGVSCKLHIPISDQVIGHTSSHKIAFKDLSPASQNAWHSCLELWMSVCHVFA